MTMRNEGNAGKRGGPNGDIIVVFQELKHQHFVRNGDDIVYDLFINFPQAALGSDVEVPTLIGKAMLRIDAGTQPGKILRLRGKGLPDVNGYGKGIKKEFSMGREVSLQGVVLRITEPQSILVLNVDRAGVCMKELPNLCEDPL